VDGPGEEVWTSHKRMLLDIFTHRTPGSKNLYYKV